MIDRLAKGRQQQENPRQTLFARIEKLIEEIGLALMLRTRRNFEGAGDTLVGAARCNL
jgi:hypothetical protein